MNIRVNDALAKRLNDLAVASGRKPDDLVQDALVSYLDEVAGLRESLDTRYDEAKAGTANLISGNDAVAHLRERSRQRRLPPA
jgi:predicted transcriptional regulator